MVRTLLLGCLAASPRVGKSSVLATLMSVKGRRRGGGARRVRTGESSGYMSAGEGSGPLLVRLLRGVTELKLAFSAMLSVWCCKRERGGKQKYRQVRDALPWRFEAVCNARVYIPFTREAAETGWFKACTSKP